MEKKSFLGEDALKLLTFFYAELNDIEARGQIKIKKRQDGKFIELTCKSPLKKKLEDAYEGLLKQIKSLKYHTINCEGAAEKEKVVSHYSKHSNLLTIASDTQKVVRIWSNDERTLEKIKNGQGIDEPPPSKTTKTSKKNDVLKATQSQQHPVDSQDKGGYLKLSRKNGGQDGKATPPPSGVIKPKTDKLERSKKGGKHSDGFEHTPPQTTTAYSSAKNNFSTSKHKGTQSGDHEDGEGIQSSRPVSRQKGENLPPSKQRASSTRKKISSPQHRVTQSDDHQDNQGFQSSRPVSRQKGENLPTSDSTASSTKNEISSSQYRGTTSYNYEDSDDCQSSRQKGKQGIKTLPQNKVRGASQYRWLNLCEFEDEDYNQPSSKKRTSGSRGQEIIFQFKTVEGLEIKLCRGSIVELEVDAIVNAANEKLVNGAGVARAISNEAGSKFDKECRDIIQKKGPIKVSENYVTGAGALPCKHVIHAVGPRWYHFTNKEVKCLETLKETVFNILKTAFDCRFRVVAMPPISSGLFGVPKEMCAAMYILGIVEFSRKCPKVKSKIKEFHIIDLKDEMLQLIQQSFIMCEKNPKLVSPTSMINSAKPPSTNRVRFEDSHHGNTNFQSDENDRPLSSYRSKSRSSGGYQNKTVTAPGRRCRVLSKSNRKTLYLFGEKIEVHVYKGDITSADVHAIVSTENCSFDGSGGLSKAIRKAGGPSYLREIECLKNVKLYHTNVLQSKPGDVLCQRFVTILHVIIEQLSAYTPPTFAQLDQIEHGILKVLQHANNVSIKKTKNKKSSPTLQTIGVPLLGAGALTTPLYIQKCCERVFKALMKFTYATKTEDLKLREIHIVDLRPMIIEEMNETFHKQILELQQETPDSKIGRGRSVRFQPDDKLEFKEEWRAGSNTVQNSSVDSYMENLQVKQASERGNLTIIYDKPVTLDMNSSQTGKDPEDFNPLMTPQGATAGDFKGDNCCIICMDTFDEPVRLTRCGHMFCRECITQSMSRKPICPVCNTVYGMMQGDQPTEGSAKIYLDKSEGLPGYEGYGTIVIAYSFSNGIQSHEHPNPGKSFKGLRRQCFLPYNKAGTAVLRMLQKAFQQRLIFTIGQSRTSGEENVLTWNDIHHKTRRDGGPEKYGYPDPEYLERVTEELNAKGIEA